MKFILKAIISILGGGAYIALIIFVAQTYNIPLAISLAALTVATVAAIANLLSLKWSKDIIRPFLSCQRGHVHADIVENKHVNIPFKIYNTGSLPATNIDVVIDFFDRDEDVSECNHSSEFESATKIPVEPMLLPNAEYTASYVLDLPNDNDLKLWDSIK